MFCHRLITVFPLTLKIGMTIVFVPVASMNIARKSISITTNGFFVFRNNMNMSVENTLVGCPPGVRINVKSYHLWIFFELFNSFPQQWDYSFLSNGFIHTSGEEVGTVF